MSRFAASPYTAVIVGLLLLLGIYVGSYLLLVRPMPPGYKIILSLSGGPPSPMMASYQYGGRCAVDIFAPLEHIDRRLRRDVWER